MNTALQSLSFNDDTIFIIDRDGEPMVPLKPLCENIGLDWKSQHRKLIDRYDRSTIVSMTTVAEDGKQREMTCLPLRKVNGWLMSISPKKVSPEVKPKLIRYQNECDEVLWNYWTKGMAVNATIAATHIMVEEKEYIHLLEHYHTVRGKKCAPAVTADESAGMKKAILAGMTTSQVAKKYERSKSTVKNHTMVERKRIAVEKSGQMMLPLIGGHA